MSQVKKCEVCLRGIGENHSCVAMFESSLAEMGITAATARQDMPRMMEAQARSRLQISALQAEIVALKEQIAAMGRIRIEHPYGDPITIYQEQLLEKRHAEIARLTKSCTSRGNRCLDLERELEALRQALRDALRHLKEGNGSNLLETIADCEEALAVPREALDAAKEKG